MRDYSLSTTFISSNTPHKIIERLTKYEPLFIYLGLYAATGIKLSLHIERNIKEIRKLIGGEFAITIKSIFIENDVARITGRCRYSL